jgi:large conductance mechanosensitive channel
MLKEFREFILRGNVIDLAVAVVIGAAFGAIVTSLVENIITPLIGAIGGIPDFSGLSWTLNGSEIRYGAFLNSLISFLLIATVIFFAVIKPMNTLMARLRPAPTLVPTTGKCPLCLSDVPLGAVRCPFCTQEIVPVAA